MYETGDPAVVSAVRRHPAGTMVQLYNLADRPAQVPRTVLTDHGLTTAYDHLAGMALHLDSPGLKLPAYAAWWVTATP
jgi:hypothetical protein